MELKVDHLSKTYPGDVNANTDLNFSVEQGECLGIVGPNGSGKTTMVRQILKILSPTKGTITVDGGKDYLAHIAYVPQVSVIYSALSARENILLAMQYNGVKKDEREKRADEIIELCGLESIERRLGYTFSIGQRKLVGLACALGIDTEFLILDEPTSMIDILTKERIWKIIRALQGRTGVILASHDMEEIKQLCDKVLILKRGQQVFYGNVSEVGQRVCSCTLRAQSKEKINSYLQSNKLHFQEEGDMLKVFAANDLEMFHLLEKIKMETKIDFESIEYPAFYEGVMSYVE